MSQSILQLLLQLHGGSPYCSGATTALVTLNGATGGTFSATTGLIIDATTGTVDLSSPAGNYIVTYTIVASGGCNAISFTTPIIINATTTQLLDSIILLQFVKTVLIQFQHLQQVLPREEHILLH